MKESKGLNELDLVHLYMPWGVVAEIADPNSPGMIHSDMKDTGISLLEEISRPYPKYKSIYTKAINIPQFNPGPN